MHFFSSHSFALLAFLMFIAPPFAFAAEDDFKPTFTAPENYQSFYFQDTVVPSYISNFQTPTLKTICKDPKDPAKEKTITKYSDRVPAYNGSFAVYFDFNDVTDCWFSLISNRPNMPVADSFAFRVFKFPRNQVGVGGGATQLSGSSPTLVLEGSTAPSASSIVNAPPPVLSILPQTPSSTPNSTPLPSSTPSTTPSEVAAAPSIIVATVYPSTSAHSQPLTGAAVAGISIGSASGVLLLAFAGFLIFRQRQRRLLLLKNQSANDEDDSGRKRKCKSVDVDDSASSSRSSSSSSSVSVSEQEEGEVVVVVEEVNAHSSDIEGQEREQQLQLQESQHQQQQQQQQPVVSSGASAQELIAESGRGWGAIELCAVPPIYEVASRRTRGRAFYNEKNGWFI